MWIADAVSDIAKCEILLLIFSSKVALYTLPTLDTNDGQAGILRNLGKSKEYEP